MDLLLEKLIIIDAIAFGEIWHFIKANKSKSPAFGGAGLLGDYGEWWIIPLRLRFCLALRLPSLGFCLQSTFRRLCR